MKKPVVILISAVALAFFVWLVHYGWTHRWGGEMDTTVQEPLVLTMVYLDKELALESYDFDAAVWRELPAVNVPLLHQITVAPWGRNLVPAIQVRAFHNGRDAYFLLEWQDETTSYVHGVAKFADSVAVAFSLAGEAPSSSIMMGFQSPINIWQWKANLDAEFWGQPNIPEAWSANEFYSYSEKAALPNSAAEISAACQDIIAIRPGSVTLKEPNAVSGRGHWRDGNWRIVIKRKLSTADSQRDIQLAPGKQYISLAVWDGNKKDRGSRKSMSEWVVLDIQPKTSVTPMASAADHIEFSGNLSARILQTVVSSAVTQTVEPQPAEQSETEEPRLINILAKRFIYMPSEITLQRGELVTLRLESLDVTHGLYLDGYGIDLKARPGKIGKATFRADKTGRFTFRCSETCGEFHPYMIGYMTVEPNSRFHLFVVVVLGLGILAAIILFRRKRKGVT